MWISMKSNYIKINCEWCISNGNVMNAFAVVRCYEFIVCTFERCSLSYRLIVRFSDCTVRLCATCPILSEQWTQDQKLLFLRREWKIERKPKIKWTNSWLRLLSLYHDSNGICALSMTDVHTLALFNALAFFISTHVITVRIWTLIIVHSSCHISAQCVRLVRSYNWNIIDNTS